MVLYIYFDNEIMLLKNPCKNKKKLYLIFLDKLAEIGYNELIKNEE